MKSLLRAAKSAASFLHSNRQSSDMPNVSFWPASNKVLLNQLLHSTIGTDEVLVSHIYHF